MTIWLLMGVSMMNSAVLPYSYALHFIVLPFGHLIGLHDWLGLAAQLLVGHSYSITTKQCIRAAHRIHQSTQKAPISSGFLALIDIFLTGGTLDKPWIYADADDAQSEPEFRTLRKSRTLQTAIRLPSFLGAGNAPDLHKRQTVERDTPNNISTTGRRTKAWSGRPLKLRRGSGRVVADALRLRSAFTSLAATACSFSFMDGLQVCATGRTQHAHAQLKVFTFLF